MAVIGCLGDIPFVVSEDVVRTLEKMIWSGSARYVVHERHGTNALTEFTGIDPDKITFDLTLSRDLGTDPIEEVAKIIGYERNNQAVPLTIGEKAYGKYRWNVTKHSVKMTAWFRSGNVHTVTMSVNLQEYLRS